jgi:hypothetical protein
MPDSNLDEVLAALNDLAHAADLDSPGDGAPTLADELFDVAAEHTYDRAVGAGKAPDGSVWDDNALSTKRRKRTNTVGVESGNMLSLDELKGERTIHPTEAILIYGKSEWARRKLQFFSRGDRSNPAPAENPGCSPSGASSQPAREVWGLDQAMEDDMAHHVEQHLRRIAGA